jgi:hypothetical protein
MNFSKNSPNKTFFELNMKLSHEQMKKSNFSLEIFRNFFWDAILLEVVNNGKKYPKEVNEWRGLLTAENTVYFLF